MLKRLNNFNLGRSIDSEIEYDYYSFTDQPITLIDIAKVFRSVQSQRQKDLMMNALLQFVNGLILIAISFLGLPEHNELLVNMMLKLGDNRCVDLIMNQDV